MCFCACMCAYRKIEKERGTGTNRDLQIDTVAIVDLLIWMCLKMMYTSNPVACSSETDPSIYLSVCLSVRPSIHLSSHSRMITGVDPIDDSLQPIQKQKTAAATSALQLVVEDVSLHQRDQLGIVRQGNPGKEWVIEKLLSLRRRLDSSVIRSRRLCIT